MKLNLNERLKDCPYKCLSLIPTIYHTLAKWEDSINNKEPMVDFSPKVILLYGSRNSAKSQFVARLMISAIEDGYLTRGCYCTATESGLRGCVELIESLCDCTGTGTNGGKSDPMYRLYNGARIDFDFLNRSDTKSVQRKMSMLVVEELETMDTSAIASLETVIRHVGVIILISNKVPLSVKEFANAHDAICVNVNWWDNRVLPEHIKQAYEKARVESPSYYRNHIMYSDTGVGFQWFDASYIDNFLTQTKPNKQMVTWRTLGVDIGAGTGNDASVICLLEQTNDKQVFVSVIGQYQLEAIPMAAEINKQRSLQKADQVVIDAQGIGLPVLQVVAPDMNMRRAMNIEGFHEDGSHSHEYFNCRSEAYGLIRERMMNNTIHFYGLHEQELREELQAQTFYISEGKATSGKQRLASKQDIKKCMSGHSPNIADAIAIGLYKLTYAQRSLQNSYSSAWSGNINISGVPGL